VVERNARVATRTGDDGSTGLLGAGRVPKWHPRMEALGAIDEATSALGLARAQLADPAVGGVILALQQDLYLLMAELATPPEHYERLGLRITAEHLAKIDGTLEDFRTRTRIGHQFIIPGASVGGAALDLARTIIRRGERQVARLLHDGEVGNAEMLRYLNRASDLVFVLARFVEGGESDPTTKVRGGQG
jgi:cob(I)alamin adenosyltransferase